MRERERQKIKRENERYREGERETDGSKQASMMMSIFAMYKAHHTIYAHILHKLYIESHTHTPMTEL